MKENGQPKGSQLVNQAIVGLNFGEITTKPRKKINDHTYTDLSM